MAQIKYIKNGNIKFEDTSIEDILASLDVYYGTYTYYEQKYENAINYVFPNTKTYETAQSTKKTDTMFFEIKQFYRNKYFTLLNINNRHINNKEVMDKVIKNKFENGLMIIERITDNIDKLYFYTPKTCEKVIALFQNNWVDYSHSVNNRKIEVKTKLVKDNVLPLADTIVIKQHKGN